MDLAQYLYDKYHPKYIKWMDSGWIDEMLLVYNLGRNIHRTRQVIMTYLVTLMIIVMGIGMWNEYVNIITTSCHTIIFMGWVYTVIKCHYYEKTLKLFKEL